MFLVGVLLLAACGAPQPPPAVPPAEPAPPAVEPAAGFLEQYARTYRFTLGQPKRVGLVPDGSAVLFLRSPPESFVQDLYTLDTASGEVEILLTAEQILQGAAEDLSVEEKARRERMRQAARGIAAWDLSRDGDRILVPLSGRLFLVDRASREVRELSSEAGYAIDPQLSPDGTRLAAVRDGDLYVMDVATGEERRLTRSGQGGVTHGLAEFVAQEEMDRYSGFWWSPDGARLAVQRTDTRAMQTFHIADPMHPAQPPATFPYPRAGQANADVRLGLVDVEGGPITWIDRDREAWPYLAAVDWEHGPLTLVLQDRLQHETRVVAVDAGTGQTRTLWTESDPAWVNLPERLPTWLRDGSGWLWATERGGAWQLELRDPAGELLRTLTPPGLGMREFVHADAEHAWFRASSDPRQAHLWRVPLAGGEPVRVTEAPGRHTATFARQAPVYVRKSETRDGEVTWRVAHDDGPGPAVPSVAEGPPFLPEVEYATVGERDWRAALIRPRGFEPGASYPVLVHVYGGPLHQMVRATPRRMLLDQWYADHGFVVVRIDGRGTPGRGRAWERAIDGDLITVPLADQVAALQALGDRYSELDLDRVGVFGFSFGGYFAAHAVMQRPDVFDAAVAGAPVAQWSDYDTHYTERYMGLPADNPEGYAHAGVLAHAPDLERPLLILHGTSDDNVYFMHALKMSNALFRAGRDHEFLPLSGFTHMVADPNATRRLHERVAGFLVEHLRQESGQALVAPR